MNDTVDNNPCCEKDSDDIKSNRNGARLLAGIVSHEGQERLRNEDTAIIVNLKTKHGQEKDVQLCIVADGAGGMAAGNVASDLTAHAVEDTVTGAISKAQADSFNNEHYDEWLKAAVETANRLVYVKAQQNKRKMAATLVAAIVVGSQVHIANVGDSRAYLVDEFGLSQITQDHSAAQELLSAGLISRDEVKGHPFEHILTRAIGPEAEVKPDLYTTRAHRGDRLLLCSDGLTNMVNDDEIWQIVWDAPTPQIAAQRLIDAANRAGGKDNITAVVVEIRP